MWKAIDDKEHGPIAAFVVGSKIIAFILAKYLEETPELKQVYSEVMDMLNNKDF